MQNKTIEKILKAWENNELTTDSRIVDFAKANKLKPDDIDRCIANNIPEFEKCHGCEHILYRCYLPQPNDPCYHCSRRITISDNYQKSSKRYRIPDSKVKS